MKLLAPNVLRLLISAAALLLASTSLATSSFSTVVIDPGHGGFDRGGIPGQLVPEKNVALDTALRLQRLLQQAGLHTVLTRSTDVFIPLPQRAAIANAQPQSIFVSIHYNAARRQGAHGIETYFEDSRGAALAARIQRQIISRVSTDNRGIRHATYYVLRKYQKPAVLGMRVPDQSRRSAARAHRPLSPNGSGANRGRHSRTEAFRLSGADRSHAPQEAP